MTFDIRVIGAVIPHALLRSRHFTLWKRASDVLTGCVGALVERSRSTKLRVSETWLREYEVAAAKRQDGSN